MPDGSGGDKLCVLSQSDILRWGMGGRACRMGVVVTSCVC
jgi:hypothetical protein